MKVDDGSGKDERGARERILERAEDRGEEAGAFFCICSLLGFS